MSGNGSLSNVVRVLSDAELDGTFLTRTLSGGVSGVSKDMIAVSAVAAAESASLSCQSMD
jgi:hypothetical protein